jgi:HAD superfamily hydrolase (TIGR01459 family)
MRKTNMKELSKKFNFFLFDQWGVLHNGKKIFKFTNKSLKTIKHKKLYLISNTSQTVYEFKSQTLKKINLNFHLFKEIITAGETLINITLNSPQNIISKIIRLKKAFLISNKNEKEIVKKLKISKIDHTKCKFILSLSLKPGENLPLILKKIRYLSKKKIPMICTNPDLYTFKNNKRHYQIGYLAKKYSDFGGKVFYVGKPYKEIFNCIVKSSKKRETIMIGDNLKTDILGGKNAGISTALAFDGFKKLYKFKSNELALKAISKSKIKPDYLIKNISIT